LNFQYPSDGSIKIELVSDNPIGNYQIKTIADKTIVQIKGARSTHHPSYLVRNSFDVEVQSATKDFDGEPGVELIISAPRGATVLPSRELNKIYFLVSLNTESKTSKTPLVRTKDIPAGNFQTTVRNRETSLNSQEKKTAESTRNQQGNNSISGQVKDVLGDVIVGAQVVITDKEGNQRSVQTNQDGVYRFTDLAAGKYILKVSAPNFSQYESKEIEIGNKPQTSLNVTLKVNLETHVVTVGREEALSSDLDNNTNGIVLRDAELNSLPEDPQGLAMALQGLAAAAGNQLGGEVIVDGFPAGASAEKAIREIRINKNPYSAEFPVPATDASKF
jgi:hypothetical protein